MRAIAALIIVLWPFTAVALPIARAFGWVDWSWFVCVAPLASVVVMLVLFASLLCGVNIDDTVPTPPSRERRAR